MALMTAEATVELDLILEAAYEAAEKGEVLVEISWFYQLSQRTQEVIRDYLETSGYNLTTTDDGIFQVSW